MTDANPAESPSRALILGTSPIAFELEQAYRRLGFVTRTGAASDADEFRPDIIVTAGEASDAIGDVEAAAERAAQELGVSRFSIYNYLNEIDEGDQSTG